MGPVPLVVLACREIGEMGILAAALSYDAKCSMVCGCH
ncbi:hypothetical protein I547_7656 [Mycobacterium kansasii 824]|nr:hypothetical protein I547_7656 [Mycobacterium kansasii 824]